MGKHHTHIYFVAHSPIRFSTVKKLFPPAHIESAYGTSQENRDYITKSGKHKEADGRKTSVHGTFEEWGEMPTNERMGKCGELQFIFDMIQSGLSDAENALSNASDNILPREWTGIDSRGVTWRGYSTDGEITSFYPE